jgi:hypothetical protein
MRYLDIETPKIRMPLKSIKIDTDEIRKAIYDYDDGSLDFIDTDE